jgi:hypothetical protein
MVGRVVAEPSLVHPGDKTKAGTRHPQTTTTGFQNITVAIPFRVSRLDFI